MQEPTQKRQYDVVIIGAGLAGLTLALQVQRIRPETRIALIERGEFPRPEGLGTVGESSVEVASHYFDTVLGLKEHLEAQQLPKLGLRYFLEAPQGSNLHQRLEVGNNVFAPTPSYQIDRARLENHLYELLRASGVAFYCGTAVREVSESAHGHALRLNQVASQASSTASPVAEVEGRWMVDASGRAGLLRKKFSLQKKSEHQGLGVWWRMKGRLRVDDWCDDAQWQAANKNEKTRWYSTNHLMGRGYWIWVIPLAPEVTSFGIVADSRLHSFSEVHTFDKVLLWLERHEPQLAALMRERSDAQMDFGGIKQYSYGCTEFVSPKRWALSGEASLFIDPFYSPGADFIAIANGYISDLIQRDLGGETIDLRASICNELFLRIADSTQATFFEQYPIMGNPLVLPLKVYWDWSFYWHFLGRLYFEDALCDLSFMSRQRKTLECFHTLNTEMQALFRRWNLLQRPAAQPGFMDLADYPYLFELNRSLSQPDTDTDIDFETRFSIDLLALKTLAARLAAHYAKHTGHSLPQALSEAVEDPACEQAFPEGCLLLESVDRFIRDLEQRLVLEDAQARSSEEVAENAGAQARV